jgi:GT2 family glycosyltransferase
VADTSRTHPAPDVSVVVVNWKQPELTVRCVESLLAQQTARSVEVVIVENEAAPGSAAAWRTRFTGATVVESPRNEGFAGGVRLGVEAASGAVIALLNNDAVADPGFVAAGLERLEAEGPQVAAVAAQIVLEGRFVPADGDDGDEGADALVGAGGAVWTAAPDGEPGGVRLLNSTGVVLGRSGNCFDRGWLAPAGTATEATADAVLPLFAFSGGAVFLRANVLAELGGFDAAFFMYYEDVDLSWRMRLHGYDIVYEPRASVVHRHAGSSSHDSPLIRAYSMRNRTLTMLKSAPAAVAWAVVARSLARAGLDAAAGVRARATPGRRSNVFLGAAGWRLYFGSLVRYLPRALRERRASDRRVRRSVYRRFAVTGR